MTGVLCAEEGRTKGCLKGCERGACADETRSGTCGPFIDPNRFANRVHSGAL